MFVSSVNVPLPLLMNRTFSAVPALVTYRSGRRSSFTSPHVAPEYPAFQSGPCTPACLATSVKAPFPLLRNSSFGSPTLVTYRSIRPLPKKSQAATPAVIELSSTNDAALWGNCSRACAVTSVNARPSSAAVSESLGPQCRAAPAFGCSDNDGPEEPTVVALGADEQAASVSASNAHAAAAAAP